MTNDEKQKLASDLLQAQDRDLISIVTDPNVDELDSFVREIAIRDSIGFPIKEAIYRANDLSRKEGMFKGYFLGLVTGLVLATVAKSISLWFGLSG